MRFLFRLIGIAARPLRGVIAWVGCELAFGELMGAAIVNAVIFGIWFGWRGFLAIVAGYFGLLAITWVLDAAICVADSDAGKATRLSVQRR